MIVWHVLQIVDGHEKVRTLEAPVAPSRGDTVDITLCHNERMRGHVEHVHWRYAWGNTGSFLVAEVRLTTVPGKQKDIHTNPKDVVRSQTMPQEKDT